MGWRAFAVYLLLKMKRSVSDPHHLALGVAIGMWANFLPLPGMGASLSLGLAWMLRGSLFGAFIGQTLGNAWTMPFIWWLCYKVGLSVFPLNEHSIGFKMLMHNFNFDFIMANWAGLAKSVFLPLTVGGQMLAIPLSLLTYWFVFVEMKEFGIFGVGLGMKKHGAVWKAAFNALAELAGAGYTCAQAARFCGAYAGVCVAEYGADGLF